LRSTILASHVSAGELAHRIELKGESMQKAAKILGSVLRNCTLKISLRCPSASSQRLWALRAA
jgi:hypothetical protein